MKSKHAINKKNRKILFAILLFGVILFLSNSVLGETYEKEVNFVGSGVNIKMSLKFSTSDSEWTLKDSNNNVLQEGDYVCDFSKNNLIKDNFFEDENGEWYFNGGTISSPKITFNNEKFDEIISNITKYISLAPQVTSWQKYFNNEIEFSKINYGNSNRETAVVCKSWEKGISCFAFTCGAAGDLRIAIPKECYNFSNVCNISNEVNYATTRVDYRYIEKCITPKSECLIIVQSISSSLEEALAAAQSLNLQSVSSTPNYELLLNNLKLNLLDKIVLSFNLKNSGEIPLRIKNLKVLFNNKEVSFIDVKNVINTELDIGSSVEVVLQLEKFFDDPCELLNKEIKVVVEYDAPRFKCNYKINGSVEGKIKIDENYKTNYELRVIYPEDDFYVSSKNPGTNFNIRKDLHVGNDDGGILRTYIYTDVSKINKTNLLKALLTLSVMQIKGDSNELVFYELPNNFNPKNIKWNLQPKIGEKIESKLINSVGDFVIDVTEYVKKGKGYGFSIRAYDESKNSDTIINSLESEQKPKIKLYYKSEKTLKEQCTIG